ncbi:MAG: spondin domain-containing protein [Candidatus Thiodiazotropha sp.]|nr:spondin domain-containing protein [Candidatus Thiodiazotropha sp.]MCM8885179.1 spondin domain-containing protein [Candidatus Thiodiazotropha sp.]MCM8921525.1 spondin domain-containing protein [Candidatus Thiodiazotropha sp.]
MDKIIPSLAMAGALLSAPVMAQDLTISITNLTHGTYFTPLLVAAHAGDNHLFRSGESASISLQAMAEGGDISGLSADMAAVSADTVENPVGGLLAPGASTSFDLSTASGNDHLSITAMLLPSNDGFVGADSISIPTAAGTYRYRLNGYDAGTEANDEIVNGGGAPGAPGIPADPGGASGTSGTGVTSSEANTLVHIHRGVLGDSDETGGTSDLNSSVHRWLNPVAGLTIVVK